MRFADFFARIIYRGYFYFYGIRDMVRDSGQFQLLSRRYLGFAAGNRVTVSRAVIVINIYRA